MSHCKEEHNCQVTSKCTNVFQTLDELDFERGIWAAAQSGDLNRVTVLISKGENVNVKDLAGYTALHYSARNGHLDVCKYLLESGAEVDSITKAGCATSLHRACSAGLFDIVALLLKYKADPTIKDIDGKTALHRAAEKQNLGVCELLLACDPNLKVVKDVKNKTPADYASIESLVNLLSF